jgi:MerR family transcriptional regulator, heat shock protein HspR
MARGASKEEGKRYYMISAVSKRFDVHPQTLRLYERDGLLTPSRTEGNTRLYTDEDLDQLEVILNLTRNLGVNLAGVEIVLNMREKMGRMQDEMSAFLEFFLEQLSNTGVTREEVREQALARIPKRSLQILLDRLEQEADGG